MPCIVSCGIGLPDVHKDVGQGFACLHVDYPDIEELTKESESSSVTTTRETDRQKAVLVFRDVLADWVAGYVIVRSFGRLRR